jgi:oxygen-independent coproporphyrinogen-3 oxidase
MQANHGLGLARKYFDNITIDLIYGYPLLTNEKWKQNVDRAIGMNIPHLSCYALTVEPKTPLDKLIRQKKYTGVIPEKQSEQFLLLMEWMKQAGYTHYEISNFAKKAEPGDSTPSLLSGWKSRHNSSYWQGKKYLGIGPSAHSYNLLSRQWNVSNNQLYIAAIKKDELLFESEVLTPTQKMNEYIMISLRTSEGIDLSVAGEELFTKSKKYIESGLVKIENNFLILTNEGKLLADGIAAHLFF